MPSHPDRVRRAYTPQASAYWADGFAEGSREYVVTIRVPIRDHQQHRTEADTREFYRRLRKRIAAELES